VPTHLRTRHTLVRTVLTAESSVKNKIINKQKTSLLHTTFKKSLDFHVHALNMGVQRRARVGHVTTVAAGEGFLQRLVALARPVHGDNVPRQEAGIAERLGAFVAGKCVVFVVLLCLSLGFCFF